MTIPIITPAEADIRIQTVRDAVEVIAGLNGPDWSCFRWLQLRAQGLKNARHELAATKARIICEIHRLK